MDRSGWAVNWQSSLKTGGYNTLFKRTPAANSLGWIWSAPPPPPPPCASTLKIRKTTVRQGPVLSLDKPVLAQGKGGYCTQRSGQKDCRRETHCQRWQELGAGFPFESVGGGGELAGGDQGWLWKGRDYAVRIFSHPFADFSMVYFRGGGGDPNVSPFVAPSASDFIVTGQLSPPKCWEMLLTQPTPPPRPSVIEIPAPRPARPYALQCSQCIRTHAQGNWQKDRGLWTYVLGPFKTLKQCRYTATQRKTAVPTVAHCVRHCLDEVGGEVEPSGWV